VRLPFTVAQFFGVFRDYHEAVWPAPLFLLGAALVALVATFVPRRGSDVVVSLVLALLWAWLAVAYHVLFFARINPLAYVFGGVSLVGALVFVWQGVIRRRLHFRWRGGVRGVTASTPSFPVGTARLICSPWRRTWPARQGGCIASAPRPDDHAPRSSVHDEELSSHH
jgi:hypothetical protein